MKYIITLASILLICATGCQQKKSGESISSEQQVKVKLEGDIVISGADALVPLVKIWADEFTKDYKELNITVSGGGTGIGIGELQKGEIDLAMVSRELTADEECAGLIFFPVSKEGVVPIISQNNPFIEIILEQGIERLILKRLYAGNDIVSWGQILGTEDDDEVVLLTRMDLSGAATIWAKYLGLQPEQLQGAGVEGDQNMVLAVINEPFAIGYCNAHYAYDFKSNKAVEGLVVAPLDLNCNGKLEAHEKFYDRLCMVHRAAYLGKYPNLLCREIMLVTKDMPEDPAIKSFLKWIYTEGQVIAEKNGYSRLRQCVIDEYIEILQ